eukprot:6162247-Pleurochrysis_carterae.AAC.3
MDAAHMKSPATGCLLSRVTLTGNRERMPLGKLHFLVGECNWSVQRRSCWRGTCLRRGWWRRPQLCPSG